MQHQTKYEALPYTGAHRGEWDSLVRISRNATFLFCRAFMEYHNDRFDDLSIVIKKNGKMVAGLPAHREDSRAKSHGGLTYGGFFYADSLRISEVFDAFAAALRFLDEHGVPMLDIRPVPAIYHKMPSDELLHALFIADAKLTARESLLVVDNRNKIAIPKSRRQAIARGEKSNLEIREDNDFEAFWNKILIPNLQNRYGVDPVHSLGEIALLHSRFPKEIRQFNVYENGEIVAGTTVFESEMAVHPQYVSAVEDRSRTGAVDFLYHHLLCEVFHNKRYFDFGTSSEANKRMNANLVFWKEQFGARSIVQDRYEVKTQNYKLLEGVFK